MEQELELSAVIGFQGKVNSGLILHPDNEHIIFPLGTTIVIRHIISRTQKFLRGHDNDISVITVSSTGKYVASGQRTHMGFQVSQAFNLQAVTSEKLRLVSAQADIIIWDFDTMEMVQRLRLHKVLIQDLSFSHDEQYLASLGGQDDNTLVIWEVATGKAICGNPVGMNVANKINFFNKDNNKLITIHNYGLRVWSCDLVAKKV